MSSVTSHTETEHADCLLQNQFVTGGQVLLTDAETTQGPYAGDNSLLLHELKSKDELKTLHQALELSQQRFTEYSAHSLKLRRVTRALSLLSRSTVVVDIVDAQVGSEDTCHSQLLDARHQLNQLRVHVDDLAWQVNATEEQIMVYDKMLEGKLKKMAELTNWKQDEFDKCKAEKLKAIRMFTKLNTELQEMQQIASPSLALLVQDAKRNEVFSDQQAHLHVTASINAAGEEKASPLSQRHVQQRELPGHLMPSPSHSIRKAQQVTLRELKTVSALVADTQYTSLALRKCLKLRATFFHGALEKPPKLNEECQAEKDALQNTYVKAYVDLSRLKAEYEQLANSTECIDTTLDLYMIRRAPLQKEADEPATGINSKVAELQSLRPRVNDASTWAVRLQKRLDQLTNECDNSNPTVSDLNTLRDAIQALSSCPGFSHA